MGLFCWFEDGKLGEIVKCGCEWWGKPLKVLTKMEMCATMVGEMLFLSGSARLDREVVVWNSILMGRRSSMM